MSRDRSDHHNRRVVSLTNSVKAIRDYATLLQQGLIDEPLPPAIKIDSQPSDSSIHATAVRRRNIAGFINDPIPMSMSGSVEKKTPESMVMPTMPQLQLPASVHSFVNNVNISRCIPITSRTPPISIPSLFNEMEFSLREEQSPDIFDNFDPFADPQHQNIQSQEQEMTTDDNDSDTEPVKTPEPASWATSAAISIKRSSKSYGRS